MGKGAQTDSVSAKTARAASCLMIMTLCPSENGEHVADDVNWPKLAKRRRHRRRLRHLLDDAEDGASMAQYRSGDASPGF
jgi:hypothetical protein